MEWQPIESAPRDGTAFLAYGVHDQDRPEGASLQACRGDHWWAILLFDIWRGKRWVFAKDGKMPWSEPTHWMPLPAPPGHMEVRG